jgi:hypothetical protein
MYVQLAVAAAVGCPSVFDVGVGGGGEIIIRKGHKTVTESL